jgi:hypothetical protein
MARTEPFKKESRPLRWARMSGDFREQERAAGCLRFLAVWLVAEVVGAIVIARVGPEGLAWTIAVAALISVVLVMVYGSFRVLRGKDL